MEKHQGYVVERILSNQKQELCYEGPLTVENLPAYLCPPLSLKRLEVIEIKPKPVCSKPFEASTCPMQTKEKDRVALILVCHVTDRYGQCAEGTASIEINACRGKGKGNLRRGAVVDLICARFCGACVFEIQANICLKTVVSCCELFIPVRSCEPCKQLPLYPQLPHNKRAKTC